MIDFDQLIADVHLALQRDRRISYRLLKRRYSLSDEDLEDLKAELIHARQFARDEDGMVLTLAAGGAGTPLPKPRPTAPVDYTPDHLATRLRAEQILLDARALDEGERKTITALFADLKGSTSMLEALDPESAQSVVDPALQVMMDAAHRFEGYVAQSTGDGILALFGAPLAHEDHAQRAVLAALAMQEGMHRLSDSVRLTRGVSLAMRVGLNTGEVVMRAIRRSDLHADYVPIGHTINLAARMEQMAAPGSVLITGHTARLVDGYFELKPLGVAEIKGVTNHLDVFEVTAVSQLRTRMQVSARRGLAPFIGRDRELSQLQAALERARSGHGQVIGLMGEAGLGKSRLLLEFKLRAQGFTVLEAYSASHGHASPYFPLIELLKAYFQVQIADDERTRREKVIGKLLGLDRQLVDALPYYFALLNIEDPDSPLALMDPQMRRRRTFEALVRTILRASVDSPLMIIFEDLHWIDSETQGFLDKLVESIGNARIILLTDYRPEYRHDWAAKSYCTQLRLTPFGAAEAESFLSALLGQRDGQPGSQAMATIRAIVLARAEGTPFFIEELVQELFEQTVLQRNALGEVVARLPTDTAILLPATIQGVLAARIDRLTAGEKALLQQLAVIGREFSFGLARRVVQLQADTLHGLLHALQSKEFLYEQPALPDVEYLFKHALTQDVAYHSLLLERRKSIHQRTAEVIEDLFPQALDDHYADLAHHYSRSDQREKAVEYLELAGRQVARRSAVADAVGYFSEALNLLRLTPESPIRARRQLDLSLALIPALHMNRGMTSPELEALCIEARALCAGVGGPTEMLTILVELRTHYCVRGQCLEALRYAEALMTLANAEGDRLCRLHAEAAMLVSRFYLGNFEAARAHAQAVRSLYDPETDHQQIVESGFDPKVLAMWYEAMVDWIQGRSSSFSQLEADSVALAARIDHPHVLGMVHFGRIYARVLWDDSAGCLPASEALIALATEHHFPDWLTFARAAHGWATERQGSRDGLAETLAARAEADASGAHLVMPWMCLMLADIHVARGDARAAQEAAEQAQSSARHNHDESWAAECERMLGDIALTGPTSQHEAGSVADAHYQRAIAIADAQGAPSWALRAQLRLSRRWLNRGREQEARDQLAHRVTQFPPDFSSQDLEEARMLLRVSPP